MKIQCNKCFYKINRDTYIGKILVEEYKNVFGTYCPNCNNFIPSEIKSEIYEIQKENKLKRDILVREVLDTIFDRMKKKYKENLNVNRKKGSTS